MGRRLRPGEGPRPARQLVAGQAARDHSAAGRETAPGPASCRPYAHGPVSPSLLPPTPDPDVPSGLSPPARGRFARGREPRPPRPKFGSPTFATPLLRTGRGGLRACDGSSLPKTTRFGMSIGCRLPCRKGSATRCQRPWPAEQRCSALGARPRSASPFPALSVNRSGSVYLLLPFCRTRVAPTRRRSAACARA